MMIIEKRILKQGDIIMEKIYKNKITKKHYELIEKIPEKLLGRFRMIENGYTYTIPFEDMGVCENNERRN